MAVRLSWLPTFVPDGKSANWEGVDDVIRNEVIVDDEDDNPDSSTGEDQKDNEDPSDEQDLPDDKTKGKDHKNIPFHKHPRFKQLTNRNKLLEWELASMKKMLEEFGISKKDEEIDPSTLTKEWLSKMIADAVKAATTQNDTSEDDVEEVQIALEELREQWHEFDDEKLLTIAAELTDWDLDKALKLYKLVDSTAKKAEQAWKQNTQRKKAGESLWNRKNWSGKDTSKSYWFVPWQWLSWLRSAAWQQFWWEWS